MLSQSDQVRDAVNAMTDGKFILSIYYFIISIISINSRMGNCTDVVFCLQSLLIFASI